MLYSEMLVSSAIIHGDAEKLLGHATDAPCAFQLGGSNPAELAQAAISISDAGYQEVNLNCGCPSNRVQQGGIGACLMAEPELVTSCFEAMAKSVDLPVTVKCRIGIDDQDEFTFFENFIAPLVAAGCETFHIHARKAILSGLSPKENRAIPPLNYDFVRRIQQIYPDVTFILNGGIKTSQEVVQLLTEFKGVMLGRAPYNDPYLLAHIEHQVYGTPLPGRDAVIQAYRDYMTSEIATGTYFKHMAKHLFGLHAGQPGARTFRRHLSTYMNKPGATIQVLDDALSERNSIEQAFD